MIHPKFKVAIILILFTLLSYSQSGNRQRITVGIEPAFYDRGAYKGDGDNSDTNIYFSFGGEFNNGDHVEVFAHYIETSPFTYLFGAGYYFKTDLTKKWQNAIDIYVGGELMGLVRGFKADDRSIWFTGGIGVKALIPLNKNLEFGVVMKEIYRADNVSHYNTKDFKTLSKEGLIAMFQITWLFEKQNRKRFR